MLRPMNSQVANMTTADIVARIEALQNVQKGCAPSSYKWREASVQLSPLFAEMAKRQKANGGELDWRNWK